MIDLSFKKYMEDLDYIIENTPKQTKNNKTFLLDVLSEEYLIKKYNLYLKYKNTKDKELKLILDYMKNYFKFKIYLYFIICSYYNNIISFYNNYKKDYSINNYKKVLIEYNNIIKTIIERLKEGLKLKITIPYIICIKFMEQIKDYNKELYNFIKNDYLNKCRKTIGLCHLPNGKKIYKILVKNILGGLSKTPEEIHNLGLSLVKKIKIKNKNFYYTSKEKLFKDCQKLALYIYNNIIDKYFHYKPDKPFTLKKVAKELEKTKSLAYYIPSDDIVYINLSYYREVDKQSLCSLVIHECMHQYHYRFMKQYNLEVNDNIILIEGFAHYMEIYCDNYDDNNNLSILRKMRLVVDTGINYYGWTYKKAFNYMNKYLPNGKDNNINEIERFICNPSQSLCYLIGKLEIIKMRDKFLKEKRGTIKDFHHKLLHENHLSFLNLHKIK
jgi:hypothetical protein